MKILDKKTKKIVCKDCETAESALQQICGLMFSEKKNILFVFDERGSHPIHSFFVFFQFHAVYLDERMKVVDVFRSIKPFTWIVKNRKPAKYLLEITDGTLPKTGDCLCLDGKS